MCQMKSIMYICMFKNRQICLKTSNIDNLEYTMLVCTIGLFLKIKICKWLFFYQMVYLGLLSTSTYLYKQTSSSPTFEKNILFWSSKASKQTFHPFIWDQITLWLLGHLIWSSKVKPPNDRFWIRELNKLKLILIVKLTLMKTMMMTICFTFLFWFFDKGNEIRQINFHCTCAIKLFSSS